jgi:hypothetical protein
MELSSPNGISTSNRDRDAPNIYYRGSMTDLTAKLDLDFSLNILGCALFGNDLYLIACRTTEKTANK